MTNNIYSDDIAKYYLKDRTGGGIHYVVYTNENLRHKLRCAQKNLLEKNGDPASLLIHFRCRINQHCSEYCSRSFLNGLNDVWYIPSIARGSFIRKQSTFLLERLNKIVGEAAMELNARPLHVPPIASALMYRAKGEPLAVIEEALYARDKASELRECLGRATRKAVIWGENKFVYNELRELNQDTRRNIGISKKFGLDAVLDFDIIGVSLGTTFWRAREYINHVRRKKRAIVLSEFAETVADYNIDLNVYEKLLHAVRRNRVE